MILAVLTLAGPARPQLDSPLLDNPYIADRYRACGVICLTFLDHYFGNTRGYQAVCNVCPPGPIGSSMQELQLGLEKLGYHTRPLKVSVDELKRVRYPTILHCKTDDDRGHFIVSLGWDEERQQFEVFDPPGRLGRAPELELRKRLSGLALVVSNSPLPEAANLIEPEMSWGRWLGVGLCLIGLGLVVYGMLRRGQRFKQSVRQAVGVLLAAAVSLCGGVSCHRPSQELALATPSDGSVVNQSNRKGVHEVDLGEVAEGTELKAMFVVVNETLHPFHVLQVDRSCACQVAAANTAQPVAPNAETKIAVVVPSKGLDGRIEKRFTVLTDSSDPLHSAIPLTLRATVKVPLKCVPSQVMFGHVKPGDNSTHTVRLITDPPELAARFHSVTSSNAGVTIRLRDRQKGILVFDVGLAPKCPIGDIQSDIQFAFDHPYYHDVKLAVLGCKVGPIIVTPSRLYVGDVLRAGEMKVRISSTFKKPFIIRSATVPAGVTVSWDKEGGAKVNHLVSVRIEDPGSFNGESIKLETDVAEAGAITVPLVGTVSPIQSRPLP